MASSRTSLASLSILVVVLVSLCPPSIVSANDVDDSEALAIGLGIGLGVGIPCVILICLACLVLFLLLILGKNSSRADMIIPPPAPAMPIIETTPLAGTMMSAPPPTLTRGSFQVL
eukprot:NODE_3341_length_941_cov_18.985426_g2783_i0.p2 GENE.NODE_3341_length_941_cov_18.985426_g2783_i0~~NODE_3341_length_941_cov_18.985426_g2783_i0.p2  ORF type:complete len:116 (-),score=10.08 NODE_3341_length_941_cov_18.985426_g2783_i0:141-488(-)